VRKAILWFSILPLACLSFIGCGGSSKTTPPPANSVPVVLTIQDQPPAGITALSFAIQVTGVSLQTSAGGSSSVSLLSSPVTVNLSNLQTVNSLLANTTAPAGTYSGITITFANPQVSVLNNTGSSLSDGTNMCATSTTTTSPCSLTPALSASSVTITTAPFPLTLTAGTPIQLAIDFNSADSLTATNGTLGITPTVTVTTNTTPNATTNNIADFTNGTGQVTSASNNSIVVTDLSTGQPLTLASTTNTTFTGFSMSSTCTTPNTFACVQQGQIVNFNFGISGASGSGPTLQSLNLNSGITNGVTGTVIGVNPGSNQMQVLVTSVSPAFSSGTTGLTVGQVVLVNPATGATFSAQTNGGTLPAGLMFGSINDVGVGQSVLLDSTGFTAGTGTAPGTLTTDNVTLVPSQFGGSVNALNASDQSFTVNNLNGLFTGNEVNSIAVSTGSSTAFTGVTGGFNGLAVGNNVNVGGTLFNSPSGPVLVGGQVGVTGTTAAATALQSR
jgi:filamentous hemagglutinin